MNITGARWAGGELVLATSDPEAVRFAIGFSAGEYRIERAPQKRTLDANALYWSLLTQLAKAIGVSNSYMHNLLLRRYGVVETYGGKPVFVIIPDTDEAQKTAENDETTHLKPTSQTRTGRDGVTYRTYILLRGSSKLNKREFSRLIDGLISECKEAGLDCLTDRERAMLEAWNG